MTLLINQLDGSTACCPGRAAAVIVCFQPILDVRGMAYIKRSIRASHDVNPFDSLRSLRAGSESNGGGGNCTRVLDYASHDAATTCENCPLGLSELCRDDAMLHELVTSWHRLTSGVREKIVEIARGATRD